MEDMSQITAKTVNEHDSKGLSLKKMTEMDGLQCKNEGLSCAETTTRIWAGNKVL